MSEFFRKLGVSYSEIDNRYSPLMTNLSGPEAVWSMFRMSGWAVGYTGVNMLARASYSIAAPIQVDENNPKLFKVTIRNLSDRRFKVGSESTIEYFKHDLDVLSPMRLVGIHKTLPELIAKINSTAKVQLSLSDFDVENCINDDGMWHLVASEESYFFVKDSFVKFNDRTSWPKIVDWLPNWNLDALVKVNPSENETDWDRTILEENLIRINRVAAPSNKIDVKRLTLHTPVKSGDRTEIVMDRVGKDTLLGPAEYKYDRLPIKLAMARPVATDIPWEKIQVNTNDDTLLFKTPSKKEVWFREVFKVNQGGDVGNSITGSTIHLKASESNDARGKLEIGLSGKTKISFNFSANSNGPSAELMSIFIGETGQFFPLRSGTCTIEEMGRFIRLHMDSTKWDIPANGITKITISSTQPLGARRYCNVYITNLAITEELVDDAAPEFVEGTIYGQLDLINDHYGTKFTEDDIEDGIIEAEIEKSVTLVAKPGRYSFEEGSEYRIIRARDMSTVFQNKELSGFDGWSETGPGDVREKARYDYPDSSGRSTVYFGVVNDDEFLTPVEILDQLNITDTIVHTVPYENTTGWLKYTLDGETLFVPKKPIACGISPEEIRELGMFWRTNDSGKTQSIPSNYRNPTVEKDGRIYAVSLIKGVNSLSDISNAFLYDRVETHDSEWNRMIYNVTSKSVNNAGDNMASQKGPKWELFSAAEMSMESDGTDGRYTPVSSRTIKTQTGDVFNVYRGGYGASCSNYLSLGDKGSHVGFRPVLRLLNPLKEKVKLIIYVKDGKYVLRFEGGTDLDFCKDVIIHYRREGESKFSTVRPTIDSTFDIMVLNPVLSGAEIYVSHTEGKNRYVSETITIPQLVEHYIHLDQRTFENKDANYPSLAGRLDGMFIKRYDASHTTFLKDFISQKYVNILVGGSSSGWSTSKNCTRYVSNHRCQRRGDLFESTIVSRYYSANGNYTTTPGMEFGIEFTDSLRKLPNSRYVVEFDYVPTGELGYALLVYGDTGGANTFTTLWETSGPGRIKFSTEGTQVQIYWNDSLVVTKPRTGKVVLGRRYSGVPRAPVTPEPLYGIGIKNLRIWEELT